MTGRALLSVMLLLIAPLHGCDSSDADDSDEVFIRIENASGVDFSAVSVSWPGAEAHFGSVDSGTSSDYQEVDVAYRYGAIRIESDGESYRTIPIDYVGESTLDSGRYTYQLNLENSRVSLMLNRDG